MDNDRLKRRKAAKLSLLLLTAWILTAVLLSACAADNLQAKGIMSTAKR